MAEGDIYVNCLSSDTLEDLIRVVCVTSDCETDYFNCDNAEESLMDILRLLVREDASGNPAIAICGCSGGTASVGHLEFTTTLNQVAFDTTGTLTLTAMYKVFVDGVFQSGGHSRVGNVVTFTVPFTVGHEVSIQL